MSDVLERICADKRRHVAGRKAECPLSELEAAARSARPARGFAEALEKAVAQGRYGLIAEIKKASPSRGLIRDDFDVAGLARSYEKGGAACLSVLTDEPYFQGADENIGLAREASSLPILRKDFMLEAYQIVESRALGADCVLLIMAALDDGEARDMAALAGELGMDALIEVHGEAEMERAAELGGSLIGINNRDLKTLDVDIATSERLAPLAPEGCFLVSESGLNTPQDLSRLSGASINAFLVGESLMRQTDVEAATRALLTRIQPQAIRA